MKKNLTIISLPFQRLIRVTMGKHVLEPLIQKGDVLVIAPFSDQENFKNQFKLEGIYFLK